MKWLPTLDTFLAGAVIGAAVVMLLTGNPAPRYEDDRPALIREVAMLTADCMNKSPRAIAKDICVQKWDAVLLSEAGKRMGGEP